MSYTPWLRYPKTTQEKKANQENWHRGKRSVKRLPDAYDDYFVKIEKCWKYHRKTQYHIKPI